MFLVITFIDPIINMWKVLSSFEAFISNYYIMKNLFVFTSFAFVCFPQLGFLSWLPVQLLQRFFPQRGSNKVFKLNDKLILYLRNPHCDIYLTDINFCCILYYIFS